MLEHIEDDQAALAGWFELLAPGGLLVLSTPAWQERFGPWDAAVGHFRRYAPIELEELLHRVGFVEARAQVYGFPLANVLEMVRNRLAPSSGPTAEEGMEDRTAASGRVLQPSSRVAALATDVATRPFRWLQQHTPDERLATGIVVAARRPA